MPTPFSRTLRSLGADRGVGWGLATATGTGVLVLWIAWLLAAEIPVFEVTDEARLEIQGGVHPVMASVSGRVVSSRLAVDAAVTRGDVLVVLEPVDEGPAPEEGRARLADVVSRREAVVAELDLERAASKAEQQALRAAVDEARAMLEATEAEARFAAEALQRATRLYEQDLMPLAEHARARERAEVADAGARAARGRLTRLERELLAHSRKAELALARLDREKVELAGQEEVERALVRRLDQNARRAHIEAPVTGHVGEAAPVPVGSVVRAGERLGSVIPPGELRAVARFPATALGRIAVGQRAQLRLEGYDWARYGTVALRVESVAAETLDGRFRVELSLAAEEAAAPVRHGLEGWAEVEVERLSPLALLIQAAGKRLGRSSDGEAEGRQAVR